MAESPRPPLLVVVGCTAAGKSALAVHLAEACGGEVVNADAMAVYRGMDIGTAKPTAAEQAGVPHHVLSCIDPSEGCQLQRWLDLAEAAIAELHGRGRLPVVCGGSPLYVKALLEGLSAGAPRDPVVRAQLEAAYDADAGVTLFAELTAADPVYAADRHVHDRKRIVRALEVLRLTGQPYSSFHTTDGVRRGDWRTCLIGLHWERDALATRINARTRALFAAGLVDEVRGLAGRLSPEAAQAVGYKEVLACLAEHGDLELCQRQVMAATRQLAKHQRTWWKRFTDICWLPGDDPTTPARAVALAQAWLAGAAPDAGPRVGG
jgi:tRNA dimethylallyltransferase